MLAEPRDKVKWSADPRNTHWASDKSKFGYKLMSQMGWSEGKGLGANENGNVSHVKVTKKNNNLGVGAKVSNEDNWLAHQDDFNSLLNSLNKKQGHSKTDTSSDADKPKSLEATVKKSRKKIFYHKFVKSKDLSRASKEDLDSIFGNRSKSAPSTPCDTEGESGNDSESSVASCPPKATEKGFVTTTSQMSMQDYFAKKMAKKVAGSSFANESADNHCSKVDETCSEPTEKLSKKQRRKLESNAELESIEDACSESTEKVSKKQKRKLEGNAELESIEDACSEPTEKVSKKQKRKLESNAELESTKAKKKKHSKKRMDIVEEPTVLETLELGEDCEPTSKKPKKKSKKRRKQDR